MNNCEACKKEFNSYVIVRPCKLCKGLGYVPDFNNFTKCYACFGMCNVLSKEHQYCGDKCNVNKFTKYTSMNIHRKINTKGYFKCKGTMELPICYYFKTINIFYNL